MPALMRTPFALAGALLLSVSAAAIAQQRGGGFIVDMPIAGAPPQRLRPPLSNSLRPCARPFPRPTSRPRAMLRAQPLAVDGEGPDESALRYYAQLGQMDRVNTEIERLVRLYPGWTPPVDLFNGEPPGDPSEDAYWELFGADRMDELRAAIAARKKEEPAWQPSKDLANKIRRKDLRVRIMDFWKKGRWQDLVDYVKADNYNADDADVEMLWTIAEAFAKTKQTNDAISVYLSILKSSADQPARLATIQKAMANLRMGDVEKLIAAGRYDAQGRSEFAPIMVDIVRARISAYLHDERSEKIPDAELDVFKAYAREEKDPNQPGLVAWYYYKTKSFRDALDWFKIALERGGDAMIAHGLAHSLRELDMRRETEEVAYAWREPLVNNLILFVDILERDLTLEFPPFIEPERLARYAKVTMDVASGEGAQALAWYAYNSCQYDVAMQWFQRAVAWFPKEATVYGYALTLQKTKQTKEFWDLMNRYDGLFGKVLEIVFPDGRYHPPTPCDELANAQLRQQQQAVGGYTVPGSNPTAPPQGVPLQNLTAAQAAGYVANGQYGAGWGLSAAATARRTAEDRSQVLPRRRRSGKSAALRRGRRAERAEPGAICASRGADRAAGRTVPRALSAGRGARAWRRSHALRALRLLAAARLERRQRSDDADPCRAGRAGRHACGRPNCRRRTVRRPPIEAGGAGSVGGASFGHDRAEFHWRAERPAELGRRVRRAPFRRAPRWIRACASSAPRSACSRAAAAACARCRRRAAAADDARRLCACRPRPARRRMRPRRSCSVRATRRNCRKPRTPARSRSARRNISTRRIMRRLSTLSNGAQPWRPRRRSCA